MKSTEDTVMPADQALATLRVLLHAQGSGAPLRKLIATPLITLCIEELTAAGAPVREIASQGVLSVALNGHGEIFSIVENAADLCGSVEPPCAHLMEYSSAGAQLADVGAGNFGKEQLHPSLSMLAVNGASGRVYVTDDYNSRVWIFGPPKAPTVEKELTADVGVSEAKLGALAKDDERDRALHRSRGSAQTDDGPLRVRAPSQGSGNARVVADELIVGDALGAADLRIHEVEQPIHGELQR